MAKPLEHEINQTIELDTVIEIVIARLKWHMKATV